MLTITLPQEVAWGVSLSESSLDDVPGDHRGGDDGAEDPARAHRREESTDHSGADADHSNEGHDQERLVADQEQVAGRTGGSGG